MRVEMCQSVITKSALGIVTHKSEPHGHCSVYSHGAAQSSLLTFLILLQLIQHQMQTKLKARVTDRGCWLMVYGPLWSRLMVDWVSGGLWAFVIEDDGWRSVWQRYCHRGMLQCSVILWGTLIRHLWHSPHSCCIIVHKECHRGYKWTQLMTVRMGICNIIVWGFHNYVSWFVLDTYSRLWYFVGLCFNGVLLQNCIVNLDASCSHFLILWPFIPDFLSCS